MASPEIPMWKIPLMFMAFVVDCSTGALRGIFERPKGWSYSRHMKYLVLRSLVRRRLFPVLAKPETTKAMDVYSTFMRDQRLEPVIVDLGAGARGGWIGSPNSSKVLLYMHGGAYTSTCQPVHLQVLADLVAASRQRGKDLGVLFLEYGLAPATVYPVQLTQAVNALHYLLQERRVKPQDILLAGDSAGGNLAIALISAIAHPHPAAQKIFLDPEQKLAGAFLLSPWVTFDGDAPSMTSNKDIDFVDQTDLSVSSQTFLSGAALDEYNSPLIASPEWWQDLPVRDLYAVGGEYEIFLDDIVAWFEKVKVHNDQAEFYLEAGGIHVAFLPDRALKLGIAQSEDRFRKWILERV